MPLASAIDLQDVRKTYRGRIDALRGIDLRVERGEVFGLLGPNGAGKSTLVKIMMTVVRPSAARGTILDHPVGHKPTLARVGYLPENHRFPRYLTGRQTLEFFGALSGVDRRSRRQRAAALLDIVGMTAAAERKVGTYSKGMMQRIGLAQSMMSDPDLLVLDEPTDGVDPVGRREIRDVLAGLKARGKTVFVNSHLLSELELMCDRIAILVAGQVARQGTIDQLTVAKQRYEIEIAPSENPAAVHAAMRSALPISLAEPAPGESPRGLLPGGEWIELTGQTLRIGATDPAAVQPMIDAFRAAGLPIRRVQVIRPSLEDLFLAVLAEPAPSPQAPRP